MNNNSFNMNHNFNQNNGSGDIPPVLKEIKPLNNDNNNNAPTMDALGPMNIMPEKLPTNTLQNEVPILNNNIDQDLNNNTFNSIPNSEYSIENYSVKNNDFNISNNNYSNFNIPNIDNSLKPSLYNNNDINIENSKKDYQIINESLSQENNIPEINLPSTNKLSDEISRIDDAPTFEISDISLNNNLTSEYSKEELIDINDVENEKLSDEKVEKISEHSVERLKNLVKELKEEGINIEIQEFDFDKLYQLIIKIEK